MKKHVWEIDYGSGGYWNHTWKRDDKGQLIVQQELKDFTGISEVKVLEGEPYASDDMKEVEVLK